MQIDDVYMREKGKWDGCSYGKTTPSLRAYPKNYKLKQRRNFFFFFQVGFIEREIFLFPEFLRIFHNFSTLFLYFFFPILSQKLHKKFLIFWGYLQEGYLAAQGKGQLGECILIHFTKPPIFATSSCSCLEAFLDSIFFKPYMLRKLQMSSFH